jgi:hypothetical protein
MAKALKCPACGATHRLDELDGATKFRCDDCGQSLKVPEVMTTRVTDDSASAPDDSSRDVAVSVPGGLASGTAAAAGAAPAADSVAADSAAPMKLAAAAVPPPPPRRHAPGAPRGREIVGASATISVADGDGASPVTTAPPQRDAAPSRRRVHWYWRALAWIAAVPIGFVITVWPAYAFGLIRKDDVLDVFVGSGAGRYTRLAIVTVLWALVTALLVHLFVEGGRWWSARRRQRPEPASPPGARAAGS